mgnify:CR=1 FL=1
MLSQNLAYIILKILLQRSLALHVKTHNHIHQFSVLFHCACACQVGAAQKLPRNLPVGNQCLE